MKDDSHSMNPSEASVSKMLKAYVNGLLLSLVLTLGAYFVVQKHLVADWTLIFTVIGIGVVQAAVQFSFFFHMGSEPKPRWNLHTFMMMLLVLVVIVFGSIWIMLSLDDRVMKERDIHLIGGF